LPPFFFFFFFFSFFLPVSWTREASRYRQPAAQIIVSNSVSAADTGHRLPTSLLNRSVSIPTRLSTFYRPDEHIKIESVAAYYRARNLSIRASLEEQQYSIRPQHKSQEVARTQQSIILQHIRKSKGDSKHDATAMRKVEDIDYAATAIQYHRRGRT
jgi:hypothetical protein